MKGKRRRSREIAVQALYQHDLGGSRLEEVLSELRTGGLDLDLEPANGSPSSTKQREEMYEYARSLVRGTVDHRGRVDELIEGGATNWRLVRMSAVDRSILRLAVYEFLYENDVPKVVVVDEAIELAKVFGSEQSPAFVNGVLDGLLRKLPLEGTLH